MSFVRETGAPQPILVPQPVPQLLRDLVHDRTGVYFEANRLDSMLEKLEPLARARGCRSYLDYFYLLKYDNAEAAEWRRVMDAFSVQETYFWREFDQIRALVEEIVPEWFRTRLSPLRIWSAACATGEEPYTIAIALEEAGWGAHPIEIVASDASEAALAKARARFYRERSFRMLSPVLREKYFSPQEDGFLLRPEIGARVKFHWANLMELPPHEPGRAWEVVFCRNVFIYFSGASIRRVVEGFAERMPAGGNLFVGASESLLKLTEKFDLKEKRGAFVYVRGDGA